VSYSCKAVRIITLLMLVASSGTKSQTGYRSPDEFEEARFVVDAVDFRSNKEGINTLEIYYKVFYNGLSYQKITDGYEARYDVSIVVEGKDNIQLEGISRAAQIKVDTYAETRREDDFIINMLAVPVEEGQDLTIRAILTDKLSQTSREVEKRLNKRDYRGKYPALSRVQFAREVSPAERKSKFNKGDLRVIPSVTRLFGGDSDSMLNYYHEIYPGRTKDKYSKLISRIYHRVKGFVYADTVRYGKIEETQCAACSINVSDFMPGYYELELRLEGRRGRLYSKLIEEFELELTAESMFKTDYKTAVEMLKYMTTRGEYNTLKNAKTDEERRRAWDEFWRLRDDDTHDRENPAKREYFRRVRHSNRYFSVMHKQGWKTDRGMIYITYGEPDEVENYPFELATKPYQIWHYYKLSPPREFLFVDEWSDGDYELKPPYNGIGF